MATIVQKESAVTREHLLYKVRPDYFDQAKHINDQYKNLGYDYRGKIMKKMTSPELWANSVQIPFYGKMENLVNFLINQVKNIKKAFSIAHSKDSLNIN
jgi:hypothetical protein